MQKQGGIHVAICVWPLIDAQLKLQLKVLEDDTMFPLKTEGVAPSNAFFQQQQLHLLGQKHCSHLAQHVEDDKTLKFTS